MSRYIDADKLYELIRTNDYKLATRNGSIDYGMFTDGIKQAICEMPTADVVEVIRCKDCFFYQKDKELAKANYLDPEKYCALLICEIDKNGFCSYGKKNGR